MKNLYETESAIKIVPTISIWMVVKVVIVAALGTAATLAYLSKTPRKYESEAKLLIRLGKESITIDPTVTNGQVVSVSDSRESEVNAFSDLLTSRVILEKVVDKLTPAVVMGETEEDKNKSSIKDYFQWLTAYNLNPFQVYSERDDAIEHISKNLAIRTGKRSALITATMEAEDPTVAREILNEIVTQARNEHVKANHTAGSEEFFEKQVSLFRSEVAKHEDALRDLKDNSGIASFAQQQQILLERIGQLETSLATAIAEKDAVEKEVLSRKLALAQQPDLVVLEQKSGQPQTPEQEMRSKLFDLELKEQEMAAKFSDESPLLQQVRSQLAVARKTVAAEQKSTEVTKGMSKTREAMETQLQEREAAFINSKARIATLQTQLKEAEARKADLNGFKMKVDAKELELTLATANYKKYSENLEQVRIDSQLQQANISSIVVLEPPTKTLTPSSPNLLLTMVMGGMFSTILGIGVSLITERPSVQALSAAKVDAAAATPAKANESAARSEEPSRADHRPKRADSPPVVPGSAPAHPR